jgi:hypothetical protein
LTGEWKKCREGRRKEERRTEEENGGEGRRRERLRGEGRDEDRSGVARQGGGGENTEENVREGDTYPQDSCYRPTPDCVKTRSHWWQTCDVAESGKEERKKVRDEERREGEKKKKTEVSILPLSATKSKPGHTHHHSNYTYKKMGHTMD